ncbi:MULTISPECIES: metal-dependent hydrolase [Halococcus]|uniref:Membrane-bound metal-dependent hydrolase n=1 Tax=Halococcus salifodinae DSM 8989 TaxID=1227456 RepID=M0N725_9EURY|nr:MULTISPECIES: metal-dependent hydrolase [Halococcus]EMA53666.1 membrane-bound metal-dependent hydrolase [Halococcus salifodinae DSM 8989]
MWPWGHLAVGYLLYSGLSRWQFDRVPGSVATLAVAFGTQFPDLVDKPLAWTFGVLASGRSLTHSLLTAVVICGLVVWYARRHDHSTVGIAFAVGYLSHPFADGVLSFVSGDYQYLAYLGWPLLDLPPYDTSAGFVARVLGVEFTPFFALQIALVAVAFVVWVRDGRPGLAAVRGWVVTWRERAAEQ